MSSPTPTHLRALYRSLLRELPARPTRSPLHLRLRDGFSPAPSSSSPASTTAERAARKPSIPQTGQLLQYLRAQRQYVALVDRYNPGMNMDEEERVRLTARRVGMDLPVEYGGEGGVGN